MIYRDQAPPNTVTAEACQSRPVHTAYGDSSGFPPRLIRRHVERWRPLCPMMAPSPTRDAGHDRGVHPDHTSLPIVVCALAARSGPRSMRGSNSSSCQSPGNVWKRGSCGARCRCGWRRTMMNSGASGDGAEPAYRQPGRSGSVEHCYLESPPARARVVVGEFPRGHTIPGRRVDRMKTHRSSPSGRGSSDRGGCQAFRLSAYSPARVTATSAALS